MLGGRIRRRALALLGALLLVILVWPPCFASMPATGRLPPPPASVDPRELLLPPARPHPAAIMLPVPLPLQPAHTGPRDLRRRRQQRPTETAADDDERDPSGSRPRQPLSEFRRFMRVLNLTTDATGDIEDAHRHPHTRRQYSTTASSSANQVTVNSDDSGGSGSSPPPPQLVLNLRQPHENSPPAGHDYLIEPFDKNKPRPVAANTTRRKFDDTPPAADDREEGGAVMIDAEAASQRPGVSRRRSKRTAASGNPHRHQHKLAPVSGMTNGTGPHHHRGRSGGGRHQHHQPKPQPQQPQQSNNESNLERNERSANLSHISGATRKIQLFIKNRYIQLLPDGTVNGTNDDLSNYTILQRTTVGIGQIKIQAVATCLFLCMDTCGSVYGSKEFTDDCIFNEQMEQHHYNTYSSTQHSNARRTLYLALNKTGQPRKIQIPVNRTLGKLATYTKALTQTVAHDRVEQLISRLFGADHVRHGLNQLCETGQPLEELTAKEMRPRPVCQGGGGPKVLTGSASASGLSAKQTQTNASKEGPRQKKKKKRRKCQEDEVPGEHCFRPGGAGAGVGGTNSGNSGKKKGGQNQGQPRGGSSSSISSGSSSGPSISSSSVGSSSSSSSSTDQFGPGSVSNGSISVGSLVSSSSSSSISNGGPNRQGLPVAPLSSTPNVRKSAKQTKKVPGSSGVRSGSPATGPGGSGQARKPKKPTQQAAASGGKRNGTAGGGQPRGPPAKGKLVPVSSVMIARVSPKPASLMIGRSPRITTPFIITTTTTTTTTTSTVRYPTTGRTTSETTPFASQLEDTSQQLEDSVNDSELDMADVLLLQTSTELADEDELDEGSPTASSWHELLPTSSVSEQQSGCYRGLSCSSFILSLGPLVVTGATVHLLYL